MTDKLNPNYLLNTALGFLSLLLLVLLVALASRWMHPRVDAERTEVEAHLISSIIQIEVLNGCGVPGMAGRFTAKLRENGFDVVESGNFDTFNIAETLVIDRAGNFRNAQKIAGVLGVRERNIIRETSSDFYLDATVIIGSDFENLNLY